VTIDDHDVVRVLAVHHRGRVSDRRVLGKRESERHHHVRDGPSRTAGLDLLHEIELRHDADGAPVVIDDGQAAEPAPDHELGEVRDIEIGLRAHEVACHDRGDAVCDR
jgi:hypothetical protein